MRLRSRSLLGLLLVVLTACATSGREADGFDGPETTGNPNQPATTVPGTEADAPHSLGTITLGETRASTTGDSQPIISASFLPDSKLGKSCTKKVQGCEITQVPKCTTGTATGCAAGETCTFDDDCQAKCIKACTKTCQAGEECVVTGASTAPDGGMTCQKKERFDAGAIAFSGTTQAITLFPPYAITPDGNGAPFMARTEIRAQASGGAKAGFEKFDEKFLATTFLETNPSLAEIPRSEVFGSGDLAVGWMAGEDQVFVGASGAGGAAKCAADDKQGRFSLPREVIREVVGTSGTALSLSVTRERRETRTNKKAFGDLGGGQAVQSNGWLEFVTTSSETHSYASCTAGQTMCGDVCTTLSSDARNCGQCGKVCPSYCSASVCY